MLKQESFTQEKRHKQSVGVWLSLQQSLTFHPFQDPLGFTLPEITPKEIQEAK